MGGWAVSSLVGNSAGGLVGQNPGQPALTRLSKAQCSRLQLQPGVCSTSSCPLYNSKEEGSRQPAPAWMTSELRLEVSVPKAPAASSSSTARPARASCRAMARPTTPAPMTATSVSG